jgi:hypothetical protein
MIARELLTRDPVPASTVAFTHSQWQALRALRRRYRQDHDLLSAHELARLRFVRWLYRSGRVPR